MPQTSLTRDTARTKLAVLAGAARALVANGPGVSLDAIAVESGVSKGGILHHFGTKEELIRTLARSVLDDFRVAVNDCIDLRENRPGKVLRAYVRAAARELLENRETSAHPEVWGVLGPIPEIGALLQADSDQWRQAFAADGLPQSRIILIWRAADGMMAAAGYDAQMSTAEITRLRDELIRLTFEETTR